MSHRDLKSARKWLPFAALPALPLGLLAVFGMNACSYGLHPHIILEGKPVDLERLASIRTGMSEEEVLNSIGMPLEIRQAEESSSVWRYYERARLRGCTVEFLGFIPVADSPVRRVEALVFLRNGTVDHVQLSETE
jgi:hypothetical protein